MATRPTRLVGNVLPTQEPSPCPTLGRKPLASLLTQAAGGRGQPGQLPHPAALLCREDGTIVSGAKEINSNCITVTVSHNLCCWINGSASVSRCSKLESVSQLMKWLRSSKPVKLDQRLVLEKTRSFAEVTESFEQLLICVIDALLRIELWINKASGNKRVTSKSSGLQHGNSIGLMLSCADHHIALGEGRMKLVLVSFESPGSNPPLKFLFGFRKYLGQLAICLTNNTHFKLQFLLQQFENYVEEGFRVLVMLPSVRPDYVHSFVTSFF